MAAEQEWWEQRPHGTGKIYWDAKGARYRAVWSIDGNRKERRFKTAEEAWDLLQEFHPVVLDASEPGQSTKFRQLSRRYLDHKFRAVSDSQYLAIEGRIRCHLDPVFGDRPADRINREVVNKYRLARLDGDRSVPVDGLGRHRLAPRTVARHLETLSAIFDLAIADGYVTHNPVLGVEQGEGEPFKARPLAPEEVPAFRAQVPGAYLLLTDVLLERGLRIGEALALPKTAVSKNAPVLRVYESIKYRVATPEEARTKAAVAAERFARKQEQWQARNPGEPLPADLAVQPQTSRSGRPATVLTKGETKTNRSRRQFTVPLVLHGRLLTHIEGLADHPDPHHLRLAFPTSTGGYENPSNLRTRVYGPAFAEAWLKRQPEHAQRRWLQHVPGELRVYARLLLLPHVHHRALNDLRWDACDLSSGRISLRDAHGNARAVSLTSADLYALCEHQVATSDVQNGPNRVFPGKRGAALDATRVRRVLFRDAIEDAFGNGHERMRIHDFRHTFASIANLMGYEVPTISKMLGHHADSFTMDNYIDVTGVRAERIVDISEQWAEDDENVA